jgi:hypothetical protein
MPVIWFLYGRTYVSALMVSAHADTTLQSRSYFYFYGRTLV